MPAPKYSIKEGRSVHDGQTFSAAPGCAQAWMRHRSRKRYLRLGHETVVPADDEKALPRWVEALVAFMQRNSALDRLFQAADWCGRRNRLGNIDLSRDQSR